VNVRTEQALDFHRPFRCQLVPAAVEMRLKGYAPLADLAQLGERHYLEPAGIGEDGAIPADEAVKPAESRDPFRGWPQHKVIGIAENDIGARLPDVIHEH